MTTRIPSSSQSATFSLALLTDRIKKCWQTITNLFKKAIEPLAGYFLKICVFRDAALQGSRFSRWVFTPIARGIINLWMKSQGIPNTLSTFDPQRLEKSATFLTEFAEIKTTQTKDGTIIRWALYTPEKFQEWIEKNGGVREGEWIRPKTEADWEKLQRLREFKAFEEVEHAFKVPPSVSEVSSNCVLRCQGFGRKMAMDKNFIGLHLSAGFNYAIFDWRDEISAKGFFEDAEAVYQALIQEGFSAPQIKPMGSCRATFPISHLKQLHHAEGLEVVMVHPPASLESTIAHTVWPANKIGLIGLPTIEKDGADFNTVAKFESLKPGDAQTCLIVSEGDKTIPDDAAQDLFAAVIESGGCALITEPRKEGPGDPHFDEPLHNPIVFDQYLNFIRR